MTKKIFEIGDKIGRYTIDEFSGVNAKGESFWWAVDSDGKALLIGEKKLRMELRRAEFTPQMIQALSSKAYNELREEIGEDGLEEILAASKPKGAAPTNIEKREIAEKWFATHPQIPRTRSNVTLFDKYLGKMENPTFTSRDFDSAFTDLFFDLELNPRATGIESHGEAIRGRAAINKLTSTEIAKLQRAYAVPIQANDLKPGQALQIVADSMTSKEFIDWTKEIDAKEGIKQPVPPLLLQAREKTWSDFFQLYPQVTATTELKDKLLEYLTKNNLSFALQHLGLALRFLIEQGDKSVVEQESNVHSYGSHKLVTYEPRSKSPVVPFDDIPVTVTTAEINAMPSAEYGAKMLNPAFKRAVENLLQRARA
jgi:hypothetical protein